MNAKRAPAKGLTRTRVAPAPAPATGIVRVVTSSLLLPLTQRAQFLRLNDRKVKKRGMVGGPSQAKLRRWVEEGRFRVAGIGERLRKG